MIIRIKPLNLRVFEVLLKKGQKLPNIRPKEYNITTLNNEYECQLNYDNQRDNVNFCLLIFIVASYHLLVLRMPRKSEIF